MAEQRKREATGTLKERQISEKEEQEDFLMFYSLPDELQLAIFRQLFRHPHERAAGALVRAMQVCRQWLHLCTSYATPCP
jgi:hypothetical protein